MFLRWSTALGLLVVLLAASSAHADDIELVMPDETIARLFNNGRGPTTGIPVRIGTPTRVYSEPWLRFNEFKYLRQLPSFIGEKPLIYHSFNVYFDEHGRPILRSDKGDYGWVASGPGEERFEAIRSFRPGTIRRGETIATTNLGRTERIVFPMQYGGLDDNCTNTGCRVLGESLTYRRDRGLNAFLRWQPQWDAIRADMREFGEIARMLRIPEILRYARTGLGWGLRGLGYGLRAVGVVSNAIDYATIPVVAVGLAIKWVAHMKLVEEPKALAWEASRQKQMEQLLQSSNAGRPGDRAVTSPDGRTAWLSPEASDQIWQNYLRAREVALRRGLPADIRNMNTLWRMLEPLVEFRPNSGASKSGSKPTSTNTDTNTKTDTNGETASETSSQTETQTAN